MLLNDAWDHVKYIVLNHAEKFVDDLFDCAVKTLVAGMKNVALERGFSGDKPEVRPVSVPEQNMTVACLADVTRKSILNAMTAGFRKAFVDETSRNGVYPEVAEYWWAHFILKGESEQAPSDLRPTKFKAFVNAAWSRVEAAAGRTLTGKFALTQAKEEAKFWVRRNAGLKAMQIAYDLSIADYEQKIRNPAVANNPRLRNEIDQLTARAIRSGGREVYLKDVYPYYVNAINDVALLVQQGVRYFEISGNEQVFQEHLPILLDEYKAIDDCLGKLQMAKGPTAIIVIYKLSQEDREDFFRRCKGPSREQREQILREVQNLSGQIWDLAERATGFQEAARRDCEAAVAAARAAGSSLDRVPDPADLQRRAALLPSRVQAAQDGAQECAAAAAQAGQAMISAEGAAAEACKSLQDLARKKTVGDRQAVFGTVVKNVSEAKGHYASCQGFIQTASLAAARTDTVAKTAAAEADALAALLRDASGSSNAIGAADGEVAQARNLLATSRGTSASIADLHTQVSPVVQKAEGVSRPLAEDPQIRKILEDIYAQQKRVAALLGGPTDCWAIADAEIKKVQGKRAARDGNALSPPIYPNVLKQAAAAAGQQAANALSFFSEYDQRARKALEGAAFCQALAEDLAKTSATANASGGAGNGPCLPGNIAGDSGLDCPADRDRALAAMDCSGLPGSVAVWSEKEQRPGCACPDPPGWNANKTACNADHATPWRP